jgi:hypothetical protein
MELRGMIVAETDLESEEAIQQMQELTRENSSSSSFA